MGEKIFFDEARGKEFSKVVGYATEDSANILEQIQRITREKNLISPVIADYGGVTGDLLIYIQEELKKTDIRPTVYNIDIDPTKLIDFQEEKGEYMILADLREIPLADEFFDVGLSRLVPQYLGPYDQQLSMIKEIHRTLKASAPVYFQVIYSLNEDIKLQMNNQFFKGREEILISGGKLEETLGTEVLLEDEFHHILSEAGFSSSITLSKVGIQQSTDKWIKRFSLGMNSSEGLRFLFDGFSDSLKSFLNVEQDGEDRKYNLPTLLIEAVK